MNIKTVLLAGAAAAFMTAAPALAQPQQTGRQGMAGRLFQQADADRTYVFAASEHFTTHAHELLADYVTKERDSHSARAMELQRAASEWKTFTDAHDSFADEFSTL